MLRQGPGDIRSSWAKRWWHQGYLSKAPVAAGFGGQGLAGSRVSRSTRNTIPPYPQINVVGVFG